ncbi:hypothetical protein SLNSH_17060 [Alsobacter soli]|uniref:Uncharacterized protein n=1 Tax=Alsobacter soli TaxID=2109933 RepID=A0A2T1HQL7_9HYPH|nr:hypothetical protein [Alsobacter soli]PSC03819.1 hypothetical protein SLNSH_17060 [Alsobacter soli]
MAKVEITPIASVEEIYAQLDAALDAVDVADVERRERDQEQAWDLAQHLYGRLSFGRAATGEGAFVQLAAAVDSLHELTEEDLPDWRRGQLLRSIDRSMRACASTLAEIHDIKSSTVTRYLGSANLA